jgi:hypothetical protein
MYFLLNPDLTGSSGSMVLGSNGLGGGKFFICSTSPPVLPSCLNLDEAYNYRFNKYHLSY